MATTVGTRVREALHMNRLDMSSHGLLVFQLFETSSTFMENSLSLVISHRNQIADNFIKFWKTKISMTNQYLVYYKGLAFLFC